jgi:hypothetical protein
MLSVLPFFIWGTGIIKDWSGINKLVTDQIANVTTVLFKVDHDQPSDGGVPLVEVTVTSKEPVLYMFAPLWAGAPSLAVTRTGRFRDEGR